ncbi:MAG: hypothetical protein ACKVRN_12255 [Pyrinomonadaceae bacterium]
MTLDLPILDEESAIEAIEAVSGFARLHGINWALVGGVAMLLYDSDRLTKDVDIIASDLLPPKFHVTGKLRQGGERYEITTKKRVTNVDWITRSDGFKPMFREALAEAVKIKGVPVLTPEWLVILKFIAGRFKDQEDAVFLLSRPGLVDRRIIKEKIVKHLSREAWQLAKHGYQRWFDMADGRTREEERNEAEGYIDS